jgi:DNA-directed RNA polymerase specialized sigma24 family protein
MVQEERLKNWAFYCIYGHIGPEIRTRAASAEGNYESEDIWEGEEPHYQPDMVDGELIENAIRNLPSISRQVLKARYVSFPYNLTHTVAQRLRMSVEKFEAELLTAKRRLDEQLSGAGNDRVA